MKEMPRKTVSIYYGKRLFRSDAIAIESFCDHCKENEKSILIELDSDRQCPYPSQDLSRDQVKQLIKLLEDAL